MKKLLFAALAAWLTVAPVYAAGAECPHGQRTIESINDTLTATDPVYALKAEHTAAFLVGFAAIVGHDLTANTVEFDAIGVNDGYIKVMLFQDGCTVAEGSFNVQPDELVSLFNKTGIKPADLVRITKGV